jgi:hypothetical protein
MSETGLWFIVGLLLGSFVVAPEIGLLIVHTISFFR